MKQIKYKKFKYHQKKTINNRLFKFQAPYKNGILNLKIEYGIEL